MVPLSFVFNMGELDFNIFRWLNILLYLILGYLLVGYYVTTTENYDVSVII